MQRNEIVLKADLIKKKLEKVVSTNQEAKGLQGQRLIKKRLMSKINILSRLSTFGGIIKKNPNLKFKVWN
jgi:hypothetical protein